MTAPERVAGRLRALSQLALRDAAVEEVVREVSAVATDLLHTDRVHLIEVSQDGAVGYARVALADRDETYVQVIADRPSGTATVVATKRLLHVPDARGSGQLRPDYVERFDVGSALFLPVTWAGEVRHVLVLLRRLPGPFADADIVVGELIADLAGAALALREASETQAARTDYDAALARAARALTTGPDLRHVLAALAREAAVAVGGDMAGVYLRQEDGSGVATAGYNSPPEWEGYVMRPNEGVAGQVLAGGAAAIANAYQAEVQLPENLGLRRLQTAVSVPMSQDGRLLGALSVGFIRMRRVGDGDLRTLQAIADLATVACAGRG